MKSFIFLVIGAFSLSACVTKTIVKEEPGEKVATRQNLKQTLQAPRDDVILEKVNENGRILLKVSIVHNRPVLEEWEDIYSKSVTYKMQCRGWKGQKSFFERRRGPEEYCKLDTPEFIISHLLLIGFIFDLQIPFQSYGNPIEIKEISEERVVKAESMMVNVEKPIDAEHIKISVNNISQTSKYSDGKATFDFAALKVNPGEITKEARVSIEYGNKNLDITKEFIAFAETESRRMVEKHSRIAAEQRRPENKYKMNFCSEPDLFSVAFMSSRQIEPNCIYGLGTAPLKVLQVQKDGILVVPTTVQANPLDKAIYIKTRKNYVDGDMVQNLYVKHIGVFSYTNTFGAKKTVHAFQYLGDLE